MIKRMLTKIEKRLYSTNEERSRLTNEQREVIVGSLLGDLSIRRAKITHNARLYVRQGLVNKEYLFFLYTIFSDLCKSEPKLNTYHDKSRNKYYYSYGFNSISLPELNYYYELFYSNGKKVVPNNIGELLTARGLAHWIMDDGTKDGNGLRLYTYSFSKEEVLWIHQSKY